MEANKDNSKEIYLAKPAARKNKFRIPQGVLLIAFVVILIAVLFMLMRPYITGYVSSKGTFIDVLNFEADKSQDYSWKPENPGTLTSIRLSGELIGDGSAKVYLKTETGNLLIYDSEKGKSAASTVTGFALAPTGEEQSAADSEAKSASEETPTEEVPTEEAPSEIPPIEEIPIEQPPTEETPSNETPPAEENVTKEKIKKFKEICDETCLLDGLNESEYTLVIEVDGAKINLQEIIYTLKKEEIPSTLPENETLPEVPIAPIVSNITNETILNETIIANVTNITEVQIENVQEDKEIQAVIDSADFDNESGTLNVVFHHESDKIEPIAIISDYSLDYTLSANESSANENMTLTIENWDNSKYFEIKIGQHSQIIGIGDIPEYDVNAEVKDAAGEAVNVTVEFEKPVSKEINKKIEGKAQKEKVQKGKYDVIITPSEGDVKEISINEINLNDSLANLINLDTNVSISGFMKSYAIDPTVMPEFTSANITVNASGNELYKCKDWNFSSQTCFGEWIKIMDIIPGQEYTFTLTADDPGFGENATGTPTATLAFFMDDPYGGGDRGQDSGGFDECPIQLNDYGETTEKCGLWDCTAWTNGATSQQPYACSGGYNCSKWNGVTCSQYQCQGWTASGTSRTLEYCSGGWNCAAWNGNYCRTWNCATWTLGTVDYDAYCSGLWACESWTNGICSRWNCNAWTDTTSISKSDMYCSGGWNCTSWNGNVCSSLNCTAWTLATTKYDAYPSGGWNCAAWNGNVCSNWYGNTWTLTATAEYDSYCDRWNCSTWDSTKKMCANWSCLQWLNTGATDKDAYCSGLWNCTYWENFSNGTAPTVSLVAPANNYNELNTVNVTFTYNVSDYALNVSNCTFYLTDYDGYVSSQTNTTITKNTNQTFKQNFDYSGDYQWNISCTDSLGHVGWSETRNFTMAVGGIQALASPSFQNMNFSIYNSTIWTWNSGTLVCNGTLNDTSTAIKSCLGAALVPGQTYRVQFAYTAYGGAADSKLQKNHPEQNITHIGVKGAGTIFGASPTLYNESGCKVYDQGNDDSGASQYLACNVSFVGNNIQIYNPSSGEKDWVAKKATQTYEGFMYLITVGSDARTNDTSYLYIRDKSTATKQSSRINVSASDQTAPTITVYSPQNITYSGTNLVLVNFTATDNVAVDKKWYYNGTANRTYTSPENVTLADGSHTFIFYANDTNNNLNSTSVTFFVDSCVPNMINSSWSSWTNISCLSNDKRNQSRSLTQYDNNSCGEISNSTFTEYRAIETCDYCVPNLVNTTWTGWYNITACLPGDYYTQEKNLTQYDNLSCIPDNIANQTFYGYQNLTCDYDGAPRISIDSPENQVYGGETLLVHISVDDSSIDTIWYNWNGTNVTYTSFVSVLFENGNNTLTAYANDTFGNVNSTSVNFSINTNLPAINIISPHYSIAYTNKTILVNISSNGVSTWYNWNGTNITYSSPVYIPFVEGESLIYVYANNSAGLISSVHMHFFIDSIYPTWTGKETSADSSTKYGDDVYFNITLNDANPGVYIFSYDDGTGFVNQSDSWISGNEISIQKTITAIRGQVVRWQWIFNDSLGNLNSSSLEQITIANTVPVASNADIKPDHPNTIDDLFCNYTYSDADGDANSGTTFRWFKNGVLQGLTTQTISNTYTNDNEEWMCEVTPKDGFGFGNALNSTTESIGGSDPSIISYSDDSDSTSPKNVGENITFTLDWTDPDLPAENARIYVCNTSAINASGCSGKTFCSTANSASNPLSCRYTALQSDNTANIYYVKICDDSNLCSGYSSGTFEVNHAPEMLTANISPATVYKNNILTCSGTYSDSDSDSISVSYKWFNNNMLISGQTASTFDCSVCAKNDVVKCEQTPADEHGFAGSELNTSRIISNSAPVLIANITDQSWYTNVNKTDAFNLNDYFSDLDGDSFTFSSFGTDNITVSINASGSVNFSQPANFTGTEYVTFIANDSEDIAYSNNVTLTVSAVPPPSGGGGAGCTPDWQCTGWSNCNGTQTRSCADANNCGKNTGKPAESQLCSQALPAPLPAPQPTADYFVSIGNGVKMQYPQALPAPVLETSSFNVVVTNTLDRKLENVDVNIALPAPDVEIQPIHPYKRLGLGAELDALITGIGVKDTPVSLNWQLAPKHYNSINSGDSVTIPVSVVTPAFKESEQTAVLEVREDNQVILSKEMPILLEYKKFNALVNTKDGRTKDIFIGYDNEGQAEKQVSIEFTINDGNKNLVIDYLGPYTIKADSRMLLGQEYLISNRLAEKKGLVMKLKLLEKGKVIDETEIEF